MDTVICIIFPNILDPYWSVCLEYISLSSTVRIQNLFTDGLPVWLTSARPNVDVYLPDRLPYHQRSSILAHQSSDIDQRMLCFLIDLELCQVWWRLLPRVRTHYLKRNSYFGHDHWPCSFSFQSRAVMTCTVLHQYQLPRGCMLLLAACIWCIIPNYLAHLTGNLL